MNMKLCNLLNFVLIFVQARSNSYQETTIDETTINATIGEQGDSTEVPLKNDHDHHIDIETDNLGNNSQQDSPLEGDKTSTSIYSESQLTITQTDKSETITPESEPELQKQHVIEIQSKFGPIPGPFEILSDGYPLWAHSRNKEYQVPIELQETPSMNEQAEAPIVSQQVALPEHWIPRPPPLNLFVEPEGWWPYPDQFVVKHMTKTTATTTTTAPPTTAPPTSVPPTTPTLTSVAPTTSGPTTAPPITTSIPQIGIVFEDKQAQNIS